MTKVKRHDHMWCVWRLFVCLFVCAFDFRLCMTMATFWKSNWMLIKVNRRNRTQITRLWVWWGRLGEEALYSQVSCLKMEISGILTIFHWRSVFFVLSGGGRKAAFGCLCVQLYSSPVISNLKALAFFLVSKRFFNSSTKWMTCFL